MAFKPLSTALPGRRFRIVDIPDKSARLRLLGLNLAPGTTFTLLRNRKGSVVVGHCHARMAIGRLLAERILVEEQVS